MATVHDLFGSVKFCLRALSIGKQCEAHRIKIDLGKTTLAEITTNFIKKKEKRKDSIKDGKKEKKKERKKGKR